MARSDRDYGSVAGTFHAFFPVLCRSGSDEAVCGFTPGDGAVAKIPSIDHFEQPGGGVAVLRATNWFVVVLWLE